MKFIYRGEFSKGLNTQEAMGVVFTDREPSDVREVPAINWMLSHPEYEMQPETILEAAVSAVFDEPVKKSSKAKK